MHTTSTRSALPGAPGAHGTRGVGGRRRRVNTRRRGAPRATQRRHGTPRAAQRRAPARRSVGDKVRVAGVTVAYFNDGGGGRRSCWRPRTRRRRFDSAIAPRALGDQVRGGEQLRPRCSEGGHDGVQRCLRAELSWVHGLRQHKQGSEPLEITRGRARASRQVGQQALPVASQPRMHSEQTAQERREVSTARRCASSAARTDVGAAGAHRRAKQRLAYAATQRVVQLARKVSSRPVVRLAVRVIHRLRRTPARRERPPTLEGGARVFDVSRFRCP